MLLNVSHEITYCGLPEQVQDRYVRYKQGNRAIVAWMTKYAPEYKGRKTLPIKQLIALGRRLCERSEEIGTLPADVDYYFKEVIKERSYLSHHFRDCRDRCEKDDLDTVNHEHFTKSLKEIHEILLKAKHPTKVRHPAKSRARHDSDAGSSSEVTNRFDHLYIDETSEDETASNASTAETNATSECSHEAFAEAEDCFNQTTDGCQDFLDNESGITFALEASLFLNRIQAIILSIRTCWTKAGQCRIPVLAAACATNIMCGKLLQYELRYRETVDNDLSPMELENRLSTVQTNDENSSEDENSSGCLLTTLKDLYDIVESRALPDNPECSYQKPQDFLSPKEQSSTSSWYLQSSRTIMTNIRQMSKKAAVPDIYYKGVGCFSGFQEVLVKETERGSRLRAALALLVHSTSYTAYFQALNNPDHIAVPRILSLKLAKHAASTIDKFMYDKKVFPCMCTNTLGYRIAETKHHLEEFAKHKCWNLLIQSPFVAGNHTLEILDFCSYYGMHLFHYRHYVGAVLHTYNVLVQVGGLSTIPALEELSDHFQTVLYTTGSRPSSNFMSTWMRYIGARLKFHKGKRSQNQKDTWCMSIPPLEASRAAGLDIQHKEKAVIEPKFDYSTVDFITRLKRQDWNIAIDDDLDIGESPICACPQLKRCKADKRLSSNQDSRRASVGVKPAETFENLQSSLSHPTNLPNSMDDATCSHLLPNLISSLAGDIHLNSTSGNLPTARINLFAVFHSMCRIVNSISNTTHDPDTDKSGQPVHMCLCFVQTILRAADRILETRKKTRRVDVAGSCWSKCERECVECVKEAISTEMQRVGNVDAREWLFDI